MADAAAKSETSAGHSRRAVAEKLLDLQLSVAATLAEIENHKESLRGISILDGKGFTEKFAGKGSVIVKAGTVSTLKGILPVLQPEGYLALSEAKRTALIEDGLIVMTQQWTKAMSPSVQVKPQEPVRGSA